MIYLDTIIANYATMRGLQREDALNIYTFFTGVARDIEGMKPDEVPLEAAYLTVEYFANEYVSKQGDLFRPRYWTENRL